MTGTCWQAGVVENDSPRDISRRMTKLCNPPTFGTKDLRAALSQSDGRPNVSLLPACLLR